MNVIKRRALPLLLALVLLLPCIPAGAAAAGTALPDVRAVCGQGEVALQRESTGTYLFLPAAADLKSLTLTFTGSLSLQAGETSLTLESGTPFDLAALFPEPPADGVYNLVLRRGSVALPVKVMHDENVAALFLTSADPAQEGRAWVEKSKANKAKGSAVMLTGDGQVLYDGDLKQIKGRGNSTWNYPKKPYQIKLDKSADLMECGESSKTWVLLANYYDKTLLRNRMTYDLAAEMGLDYSPWSRPVDLYYDGEYRGSYLLSEKTEVGKSRVAVRDLEEAYEAANPEVSDFDALPKISGLTAAGAPEQYVDGLTDPEDLSGGYLLEMDYEARAKEEVSWFSTTMGRYLVVKSPEYASRAALRYISDKWQTFEDAVAAGGTHPETGLSYADYMDKLSLVRCYLILELSMDGDAFRSSTYFYKPEGDSKLFAGPVWDFDTAYGLFEADYSPEAPVAGYTTFGKALLAIPDFRQGVGEEEAVLHSLIRDILLSTDPNVKGERLRSLAGYDAEVAGSRQMDLALWPITANTHKTQRTVDDLRAILDRRETWLHNNMDSYTRFQDVKKSDWFAPSVEEAVGKGLFQGVSASFFAPNDSMTRGMVTTVLYRMAGQPAVSAYASPFTDVAPDQWYAPAVTWAAATGVVTGYPDGTFQPNAPVTRQELVALMHRYALSKGAGQAAGDLPATFADRDQVPDWARGDFAWAVEQSLVAGSAGSDGTLVLDPQGQATRAQGAALFLRLSQFLETLPPAEEAPGPVEPAPETQTPPAETPPAEQTPPAETTPAETPAETGTQTAP